MKIMVSIYFVYLKSKEGMSGFLSTASFPKCQQQLELDKAEIRSQKLIPGLSQGCQRPMCLSHHLLSPRMYIIWKLESKTQPSLKPRQSIAGCWFSKWRLNCWPNTCPQRLDFKRKELLRRQCYSKGKIKQVLQLSKEKVSQGKGCPHAGVVGRLSQCLFTLGLLR